MGAVIISILAVVIAGVTAVMNFVVLPILRRRSERRRIESDRHREQSRTIRMALEALLSEPVVSARNYVGIGARELPMSREAIKRVDLSARPYVLERQERIIASAFTCMWYVELTQLRLSNVVHSTDAVSRDAVSLYEHLDRMMSELDRMLGKWELTKSAQHSIRRTNIALEGMPILIDEETLERIEPTSVRLSLDFPMATDAR